MRIVENPNELLRISQMANLIVSRFAHQPTITTEEEEEVKPATSAAQLTQFIWRDQVDPHSASARALAEEEHHLQDTNKGRLGLFRGKPLHGISREQIARESENCTNCFRLNGCCSVACAFTRKGLTNGILILRPFCCAPAAVAVAPSPPL